MVDGDTDRVLRYLGEVEELAEDVLSDKRQILNLHAKQNQNREALRALQKDPGPSEKVMVCLGNMFFHLPRERTKEMIEKGEETEAQSSEATCPRPPTADEAHSVCREAAWPSA
ncbi:p53 and DNA damage-regulated protein 1 isoform X2 [Tachyglossus aculeatus]|uniref:p53 and DNA damage-regulated protein 1 isoform X2 n=1 Tax=Tachyglossus aculeatus TaxID=9261 RepID=UPI0018F7B2E6|nr:p53 and DNA damage-regulated protein 1 isoform X2 [Tachyglossus aculeatus]